MIGLRRTPEGAKPVLILSHQVGLWQDVGKATPGAINSPVGNWQSLRNGYEATQATAASKPTLLADGLSFDGGDGLSGAIPPLGSGNFSLGFWYKTSQTVSTIHLLDTNNSTSSSWTVLINYPQTNSITFLQQVVGSVVSYNSSNANNNSWHYLSVSRNSGVVYLGLDGVIVGNSTNAVSFSSPNLTIGRAVAGTGGYVGLMTDISIFDIAKYTTNYTPPARSGS
jgi:hypothetical protein